MTDKKKADRTGEDASPSAAGGSKACTLVTIRLERVTQDYIKACDEKNHLEAIKLDAQRHILENLWIDIVRLEH